MDGVMPDFVKNARAESERRSGIAGEFAAGSNTITDQLKKTVQEALDYNKDIIDYRSTALADYLASPAQAEARFGVDKFSAGDQAGQVNPNYIFNPFERNATIAEYVKNQQIPFLTANTLLGFREGQTADIVDAGTRAFNAQATLAGSSADRARQAYVDALNEFKTGEDIRLENAKLAKSSGDSSTIQALLQYLQTLKGGGDGTGEEVSFDDRLETDNGISTSTSLQDLLNPPIVTPGGVVIPNVPNALNAPYNNNSNFSYLNNLPLNFGSNSLNLGANNTSGLSQPGSFSSPISAVKDLRLKL